jgi:16S rRNA C967 or C1407 C5-methylase (RsmB/RsmF family)
MGSKFKSSKVESRNIYFVETYNYYEIIVTMSSVNPLKDARSTTKANSKAESKAKELWHRKSGAGYHLFVEYYQGQPKGVIYNESDLDLVKLSNVKGLTSSSLKKQGDGQSRAAKRRRKKQKITHPQDTLPSIGGPTNEIVSFEIADKFQQAIQNKECKHLYPFLSAISRPLPLTLRIRHNSFINHEIKKEAQTVIKNLEHYSSFIQPVSYDSSKNTIYQAVPGTNLAKFNLGRICPELKTLILKATASGIMARQELGSMLPVIALAGVGKLKYGCKLLDMCASPGSKTLQALEIVASPIDGSNIPKRKGRVVANDIHPLRLESLKDAIERSGVDHTMIDRIVFTNHDASKFPNPKSGTLFDCIIADVPCSGSGTIRKDPHILPNWLPSISNSLHELQSNILKRAIKLLKVGGIVAYSTCSINPIEDEAVVAAVLSWANANDGETIELMDWPKDSLPGFKTRPGVSSWRVADFSDEDGRGNDDEIPRLTWYDSVEQAMESKMLHAVPSLWPLSEAKSKGLNLHRCTRLLPQDNDTGGFFVALLKKNREF